MAIKQQIREQMQLTASAGVANNKFLAKIASDMESYQATSSRSLLTASAG
jgi:nucleotidyltransferase/DNA polymerase involved in DNA repair